MKYFTTTLVNGIQIVDSVGYGNGDGNVVEVPKEFEALNIIGLSWDGKTFKEVEEKETDKPVTNEDLSKKLDLIISHLGIKVEDSEEKE